MSSFFVASKNSIQKFEQWKFSLNDGFSFKFRIFLPSARKKIKRNFIQFTIASIHCKNR